MDFLEYHRVPNPIRQLSHLNGTIFCRVCHQFTIRKVGVLLEKRKIMSNKSFGVLCVKRRLYDILVTLSIRQTVRQVPPIISDKPAVLYSFIDRWWREIHS